MLKFVIFDEVMSVINLDEEFKLYECFIEIDIIVVSIAYRFEFRKFYKLEFKIVGDGEGGF